MSAIIDGLAEYGVCPKCWGSFRTKKDGNLRSHTNRDSRDTHLPFSSHCDGSDMEPERTFWTWVR